jgi:diacylglycerol kinase (ATP)
VLQLRGSTDDARSEEPGTAQDQQSSGTKLIHASRETLRPPEVKCDEFQRGLNPLDSATVPSPLPYKQAQVISNPVSGQGNGEGVARDLTASLKARGLPTELCLTKRAGEAQEIAQGLDEGVDLVVCVGGDGTLREIFTGLRERASGPGSVRVGVVPMGTGNALCADLGLPRDVDHVLEVLQAGKFVETDVANVNGELCFLIAGIGPDALVVQDIDDHRHERPLSKFSYLPAGLRAFWKYRRKPLTVELDGEPLPDAYAQVMASNLIHYGGLVKFSPDRRLDDGLFEVFLFRDGGHLTVLIYALRVLLGLVPGGKIEMRRARRIRVTSEEPVPYYVDGDPMGQTPVEIEVTSVRFQLLVP